MSKTPMTNPKGAIITRETITPKKLGSELGVEVDVDFQSLSPLAVVFVGVVWGMDVGVVFVGVVWGVDVGIAFGIEWAVDTFAVEEDVTRGEDVLAVDIFAVAFVGIDVDEDVDFGTVIGECSLFCVLFFINTSKDY